ncbi:MAG: four helix bundle protein [Planctomycetes bacterium]|nr:four helix bundle protein [Planctomycetota bacterium]
MGIVSFTQLEVWPYAHQAALATYKITHAFPKQELFGLTAQMRKAAVSIPANIAEGFRRRQPKDKMRFYNMSQGSVEELRYYLILGKDLGYTRSVEETNKLLDSVSRMLKRLILTISNDQPPNA